MATSSTTVSKNKLLSLIVWRVAVGLSAGIKGDEKDNNNKINMAEPHKLASLGQFTPPAKSQSMSALLPGSAGWTRGQAGLSRLTLQSNSLAVGSALVGGLTPAAAIPPPSPGRPNRNGRESPLLGMKNPLISSGSGQGLTVLMGPSSPPISSNHIPPPPSFVSAQPIPPPLTPPPPQAVANNSMPPAFSPATTPADFIVLKIEAPTKGIAFETTKKFRRNSTMKEVVEACLRYLPACVVDHPFYLYLKREEGMKLAESATITECDLMPMDVLVLVPESESQIEELLKQAAEPKKMEQEALGAAAINTQYVKNGFMLIRHGVKGD